MSKWLVLPAALAVVFITAIGLWQLSKARSFQLFGDIVARIETSAPRVAITFDDGPTADYTEPVLALLAAHDVRATFFVTGREVEENPDEARAIVDAGHELGNHSWSHPDMTLLGPARIAREIERTNEAIRAAGHQGEIFFRPPFGKKLITLPWYLSRNGRTTIMWDIEPETYPEIAQDPDLIAQHVLDNVRPGSIVLLHVMYGSREASRQALPLIFEGLRVQGYEIVTVSELLATP
jgi:peptidoglycan/xylan/chitin deacetylase (PgdA/CDA1 family)